MSELEQVFGSIGALAKHIDGYQMRASQVAMAQAVERAIEQRRHIVAEAGTGTGKTFAYLVPAILSGKRVVVSTGTRNLQDQLIEKDFPLIRDALKVPVQAAILKGRSNYLCLHRLEQAQQGNDEVWPGRDLDLSAIRNWAEMTRSGDIAEVTAVAEDSAVWPQVTSTVDNCLGQDCPLVQDCFALKARRKAQDVDVLIVNHHLLCADWSLKDDGFGELLPESDVVIVDEAHQLVDTATRFLGMSLSTRQMVGLAQDVMLEQQAVALDMPAVMDTAQLLIQDVRALRHLMPAGNQRGTWSELVSFRDIETSLQGMLERVEKLAELLAAEAERSRGLEACWNRAMELAQRLKLFESDAESGWIQWYESFRQSFVLYRTPLDIAHAFSSYAFASDACWVFTSATLSVNDKFDFFTQRLGLEDTETGIWPSPFNYPYQAMLYLPAGLPQPREPNFTAAVVKAACPVIEASEGRTFFLFTSYRALHEAAGMLETMLDFPLLVQGEMPKQQLLEKFKAMGNAVLLGTASFWEGVDVRGEALSCVIIDKIPFASPADPVMKARLDYIQAQGLNPFRDFQVPAAALMLKQGVGRLIRDAEDRGVLMLCDPRLTEKGYGRVFLNSLPNMLKTRTLEKVERFFNHIKSHSSAIDPPNEVSA